MADDLKDSGTVTAISVVGFIFGIIGMLGSFIPCLGSLAFYIGIPAAIISALALGIAYSQKARKTFAIVALTVSCIGVIISGWQYFSIIAAGQKAKEKIEEMSRQYAQPQPQKREQIMRQQEKSGPKIEQLPSDSSGKNQAEARKLFYDAYLPLITGPQKDIEKIHDDEKWIKKEILLPRGTSNFMQIEMHQYDMYLLEYNKKYRQSKDCGKTMPVEWEPEKLVTGSGYWWITTWEDEPVDFCYQYIFEPFYEDTKLRLYIPKDFQDDFKITLKDAEVIN